MLSKDLKKRWLNALRGDYADKKGKGELVSCDGNMCCLGVLVEIENAWGEDFVNSYGQSDGYTMASYTLRDDLGEWGINRGLSEDHAIKLSELNDASDTFEPVIKYIEENL